MTPTQPIEELFRDAMLTDAGVLAIFGQHWYLVQIPQRTFPGAVIAAAVQRVSTMPLYVHTLGSGQATMEQIRLQVTIVAGTATGGARALAGAEAVKAALQTFDFSAVPTSPNTLRKAPNLVVNQRMMIDPETPQPLFMVILDLKIWFTTVN